MKEFITDLLQKTNQAKFNLAKKQITVLFAFLNMSNNSNSQNAYRVYMTPSSSSFCELTTNNTLKIMTLQKGLYLLSSKIIVTPQNSATFVGQAALYAYDSSNETFSNIQNIECNTTNNTNLNNQGVFTQTDILIIDDWNQNLTCLLNNGKPNIDISASYTITPLTLI